MSVNRVNSSDGSLSVIASRGQFIQYSVMPTPSVDIVNKIVQYIGTTTANYTNGYFYKCTEVSTGVYNWVNIQVQTGGGGSAEIIKGYFNSSDNLFYEESTYVTPIAGDVNSLYLSLDTNLLYRYNGTIFVEVSNYEIGDGLNLDDNTLSADTVIFTGTSTEWNAVVDKSKYDIVNLTDEATGEVVDAVENGNLNPVTSNAVYDGLSLKVNTTAITNPNLLDNPWFTINQRGITTKNTSGYGLDRWTQRDTTKIEINSNGLALYSLREGSTTDSWLMEKLDEDISSFLVGKMVTASMLTQNGGIESWTFTVPPVGTNIGGAWKTVEGVTTRISLEWSNNNLEFILWNRTYNTALNLRAAKLELGTISTLAMDTAPNTVTELLKCQRYFVRLKPESSKTYARFGIGVCADENTKRIHSIINTPVNMRTSPTISSSNLAITTDGNLPVISVANLTNTEADCFSTNNVCINFTASGTVTKGTWCQILANNTISAYIDLSADL